VSGGIGARNHARCKREDTVIVTAPCIDNEFAQFHDGAMYWGTGNVYANLWRVRGPVCGDFEGLFVSVAGLSVGPI
jgi:hypothetical protein